MVDITAENRCDQYGQQGEYGKDRLSRLAHVTHIAIGDKGDDGQAKQTVFAALHFLEVAGEACCSNNKHDDVLYDGYC